MTFGAGNHQTTEEHRTRRTSWEARIGPGVPPFQRFRWTGRNERRATPGISQATGSKMETQVWKLIVFGMICIRVLLSFGDWFLVVWWIFSIIVMTHVSGVFLKLAHLCKWAQRGYGNITLAYNILLISGSFSMLVLTSFLDRCRKPFWLVWGSTFEALEGDRK